MMDILSERMVWFGHDWRWESTLIGRVTYQRCECLPYIPIFPALAVAMNDYWKIILSKLDRDDIFIFVLIRGHQ